jgi:hypothetical protein
MKTYRTDAAHPRDVILARLNQLGWSRYALAKRAAEAGIVGNRETVFRYLRGERDTSSTVMAGLFNLVGIDLCERQNP